MPSSYSNRRCKYFMLGLISAFFCSATLVGQQAVLAEDKPAPQPNQNSDQLNENTLPPEPPGKPETQKNDSGEFNRRMEFRSRMREQFQNRMKERMKNRFPSGKPDGHEGLSQRAGGGPFGRPLDLSILGLSDEQKEKITNLRKNLAPNARKIRQELKSKRDELRVLMFDPKASDLALKSKQREIHKLQEKLEDLQLDDFIQMRAVLTPEQKQKLPELKPTRPQRKMPQPGMMPQPGTMLQPGAMPPEANQRPMHGPPPPGSI